MTTLILIRHGESQANRMNVFAGQINPDLEERGVMQAELTAKYVSENYSVDKIYSSDLKRAYRTGESLARLLDMEIIPEKRLREIDGGKWEGIKFDSLAKANPKEYDIWVKNIGEFPGVEGESMKEVGERIMGILTEIAEANDGKTVAITTHATPISVAVSLILHGSLAKMRDLPWATNASVTVLEYENKKWNVTLYSEDSHLKELRTALGENV